MALSVFHLVYTWNLYFEPLLYLSTTPDLQPLSLGLAAVTHLRLQPGIHPGRDADDHIIPMAVFFLAQRAFMRGIVITGVEK